LERAARERPHDVFVVFEDGTRWTCGEAHAAVRRAAAGLAQLGVACGDYVLNWLPNGPASLLTWFGCAYLGAINVPINPAYRGTLLAHVLANSGARVMVAHAQLLERLGEVDRAQLESVVAVGGAATGAPPG